MTDKEKERARRFGAYIKELRTARGMTQDELAKKCGYSNRAAISSVEKGKNDIALDRVPAFADALGVTPSQLFNAYDYERADASLETSPQIEAIKSMLTELTPSQLEQVTAIVKVMRDQNGGAK